MNAHPLFRYIIEHREEAASIGPSDKPFEIIMHPSDLVDFARDVHHWKPESKPTPLSYAVQFGPEFVSLIGIPIRTSASIPLKLAVVVYLRHYPDPMNGELRYEFIKL